MTNTVLICDDALFMRSVIRQVLEEHGYQVVGEAGTGREAIDKYAALQPDLVTMDMVMPDVSGIEAVKEIKAIDPNARIIMCTAMGQEGLLGQATAAGASGYVIKPFSPVELADAVDWCFTTA